MKLSIFFFLFILFSGSFDANGQIGSANQDSLFFALDVIVNDIITTKPLYNCEVKVIGTDGSSQVLNTDYSGRTNSFKLKANTSYSVVVSKQRYIIGKGKETTIGEMRSKSYIHEYNIQPFTNCGTVILYEQHYKHNSITPYQAGPNLEGNFEKIPPKYYYDIFVENPYLVLRITGYQDESEKNNISIKRAQEYLRKLVELGLDKGRLIAYDGGVKVYKEFSTGKKTIEKKKEKENRMIDFRIISDDYKPKKK